ncbi:MAG: c-type cytochrome, partial [Deltaproteobacteria bacterium]|nr:c-type cytochrome [Deltaproteobacteria bacterium]
IRIIEDGLPGSAMPAWGGELSKAEVEEMADYILKLGKIEKPLPISVERFGEVKVNAESIERGRVLFKERCAECHGTFGRGNTTKRLKDDWGEVTWPRNFSKPWSFRGGYTREYIYSRITIGTPGTQMPSYDDPRNKKSLMPEERWDVVNYVWSLKEPYKEPRGRDLITALYVDGIIPDAFDDPVWSSAPYLSFYLNPQLKRAEKLYTPTIDSVSVKALYNEKVLTLLMEWDDFTKSVPGLRGSDKIAGGEHARDGFSVQMPLKGGGEFSEDERVYGVKPALEMGSSFRGVVDWLWRGPEKDKRDELLEFHAHGSGTLKEVPLSASVRFLSRYRDGSWQLMVKYPLKGTPLDFRSNDFTPIAFAAWDGSNMERAARHSLSSWAYLYLKPGYSFKPYAWGLGVFIITIIFEVVFIRRKRGKP